MISIKPDRDIADVDACPFDMHAFDMLKPELDISREAVWKFNERFGYAKSHCFAKQGDSTGCGK